MTGLMARIYPPLNTLLNSLVPFTILFILNGFIIHTFRNHKKYFQKDEKKNTNEERNSKNNMLEKKEKSHDKQLITMLGLVTLGLLFLTSPIYIRLAVYKYVDVTTPSRFATFILLRTIAFRLFVLNNAVNFFLYCLGGSKFRKDLRALFSFCF